MSESASNKAFIESHGGGDAVWLVTGVAGFIGSHLLHALLLADQTVRGIDNFSTGSRANLDDVQGMVSAAQWQRFQLHSEDVQDQEACRRATSGVSYVLHQAALGSVPRSLKDPVATHRANVDGFLNMLVSARDADVRQFVYASSSSVYGDHPSLPKQEDKTGRPLSPYALSKCINEQYAQIFHQSYGMRSRGLRYFNVFGARQDPNGAYAAVIPRFALALLRGEESEIYGDGETSRDFCYIDNVVEANLRAALVPEGREQDVFNVAVGEQTTLLQLYDALRAAAAQLGVEGPQKPKHLEFRPGDVRHSLADISHARETLGYEPKVKVGEGLVLTMKWYHQRFF